MHADVRPPPGRGRRLTIHAGEPGASVANVKARIEAAWGARAVDHVGATEVGAWGYGWRELAELVIRIEVAGAEASAVAGDLAGDVRCRLALRPRIEVAPPGSLPRYELKPRRFRLG